MTRDRFTLKWAVHIGAAVGQIVLLLVTNVAQVSLDPTFHMMQRAESFINPPLPT